MAGWKIAQLATDDFAQKNLVLCSNLPVMHGVF
jgi:hypothetical protein